MTAQSPSRLYALLLGGALTLAGMIGFAYSSDFSTGEEALPLAGDLLGVFKVNGWHNVLHLATGLAGLAVVASLPAARIYAVGIGVAYLGLGLWGLLLGPPEVLASALPVDGAATLLHLAIGVLGVAAFSAERRAALAGRP